MAQQRSTKDDFTFGSKLGSGSYGIVWLAVRKWDKKSYAVKELDLADMGRKEQEECIREVQVLAALDCPYIIKYYDSFLDKGRLYIVMEYATGGNLHSFVNKFRGELPEDTIWKLFIQTVLSLKHMHSKKILHRDLKTLNIFLDGDNNAKVGDFGVAKVLSTQTNFARTIVGTPYYLSPELCEDKPYNEKSDMWAAGVVLYEMCTRRHPFDADNQGALILKILRGKFPPVTGYSPELQDMVKRCLTQAAQKRPSAERIISTPIVQEKAAQLGIALPEVRVKSSSSSMDRSSSSSSAAGTVKKSSTSKTGTSKKSTTVKKTTKKSSKDPSKEGTSGSRKAGGSITVSGDMESMGGTSSREQAQRDIAFVFGDDDDENKRNLERNTSAVSAGLSTMDITSGSIAGEGQQDGLRASGATWKVVDGDSRRGSTGKGAQKAAWGTQGSIAIDNDEDDDDDDEEDEDEDDLVGPDDSTAMRASKLQNAVEQTKASIAEMVGDEAMNKLYDLLKTRSDADSMVSDGSSIADLSRVVFKIIPYDKAEVLSLVYKLLYLEGQLVDKD